jgi:hypothetical protein
MFMPNIARFHVFALRLAVSRRFHCNMGQRMGLRQVMRRLPVFARRRQFPRFCPLFSHFQAFPL